MAFKILLYVVLIAFILTLAYYFDHPLNWLIGGVVLVGFGLLVRYSPKNKFPNNKD